MPKVRATKTRISSRLAKNQKMIKAPGGNVKGAGPLGPFTGGLNPTVVDPKFGPNPLPAKSIIKGL